MSPPHAPLHLLPSQMLVITIACNSPGTRAQQGKRTAGNSTSTCPAVGAICSLSCLSCLAPYFPPTYWCIDQPPFSDSQTHGLHQFQILLGPGSWRFAWLLTHCCPWTRKASIPCPCHAKLSNPFFAPSYLSREKIVNAIDQILDDFSCHIFFRARSLCVKGPNPSVPLSSPYARKYIHQAGQPYHVYTLPRLPRLSKLIFGSLQKWAGQRFKFKVFIQF